MSNRRGPIERIPGISGAAVLAMSGSVLLAGLVGGEWLRRMPVQIPRTEAMTPVALLLGGLSLLIMRKHRATLGRIFAAAMIGIGIFGYARFVFGDRLAVLSHHLFYGELRSFQRSPSTALCLVLIGSALYSLHNRFSPRMVIAFLLPASCLSFFGLTNCLYGNPAFTKIEQLGWIAPIPALSLVLLCNGIIFEIPEHRVIEALTHPGLIGGIARRLIPTMILIPLTVGGIRLWAQDRGLYGTEFGVAISVTAMVISLVGIVCWSILSLRKFEAAKGKAHTEIQAQQDALDQQNRRIEQGEDELRRNNRRLAEVTRAWDLSNGFIRKVDGTITFWCEGSVQLYGWTKSQAVGKISHELLRTEFPRPLHEIEAELLDKGSWEGELCYYTSENRRKYVASRWVLERDERGNPRSVSEVNTDISDRIRAEQTNAHLASIVKSSEDAIISYDLNGVIASWNDSAEKIFGFRSSEAIGQNIALLGGPDGVGEVRAIRQGIRQGEIIEQRETVRRRKDGRAVSVWLRVSPILDQQGRMTGVSQIARDATEQKAEEERYQSLLRKMETVREEERANLAREIHDVLGQTLTIIKMDMAIAERRINDDPSGACLKLSQAACHVDETIRGLRKVANQLHPALLNTVGLTGALRNHIAEVQQRAGIRISFDENSCVPSLDSGQCIAIFRILQESLTNIIRHSRATEARVTLHGEPDRLRLNVRDNGQGFSTVGAGDCSLGLQGMRQRAKLAGGQLLIESELGRGTCVTLEIEKNTTASDRSLQAQEPGRL